MSQPAKLQGISAELPERSNATAILLVAYFDDTLAALRQLASNSSGDVPVLPTLAENLSTDGLGLADAATIEVIVGERHPLRSEDDRVLAFTEELTELGYQCVVRWHLSLDDPLMLLFAGEAVKKTLRQLGMKDNEAIESKMVSRRIGQAQQKIAAGATGNRPAPSAAEWMLLNMPNSG
jgi:hypothetical protein